MTRYRADSYIYFSALTGASVWDTTGDGVWLTELTEEMPEVKTLKVDVPGSDGELDLSEAVAGRPLYSNREVKMTLSYVGDSHADAVAWVKDVMDAVHGKLLNVSTPDSRAHGGAYIGRVSLGDVEYPGEAAQLEIIVDARPWIYTAHQSHTLLASATTYTGKLPSSAQAAYDSAYIVVENPIQTTTYASYGAQSIEVIEHGLDNVIPSDALSVAVWSHDFDADDPATGWTKELVYNNPVREYTVTTGEDAITRLSFAPKYTSNGTVKQRMWQLDAFDGYIGVQATVTAESLATVTGLTPKVRVHIEGTTTRTAAGSAVGLQNSQNGLYYNTSASTTQRVTIDHAASVGTNTYYDCVPMTQVMDRQSIDRASIVIAVDAMGIEGIMDVKLTMSYGELSEYEGIVNDEHAIELPVPLYRKVNAKSDTLTLAPDESTEHTYYKVIGDSVFEGDETDYKLAAPMPRSIRLGNIVTSVSAYDKGNYNRLLKTSVTVYDTSTMQIAAGDMPATFYVTLTDPVRFTVDGKKYLMTASGNAPFSFAGTKTITYQVLGTHDAQIDYDKGTL